MTVRRIGLMLLFCGVLVACAKDPIDGVFPTANQSMGTGSDACANAAFVPNRFIVHWTDGHVSVESSENAELFKQQFIRSRLRSIRHVEFDQKLQLREGPISTAGNAAPDLSAWGQTIAHASDAWNAGINGQGVLVAVVDAAVDYTHPQIKPRLAGNQAEINGQFGIDDDGNGFIDDLYGWDFEQNVPNPANLVGPKNSHGTHVAGIIAADHGTGTIQGLAPQAQIIPANFMDDTGSGSLGAAIQAVQYVAARGARVINASWGGPTCSATLKNVLSGLAAQNILFIAASGNDGIDLDYNSDFPANFNFSNQLNVAATNSNDFMTSWSNTSFNIVQLGAPGDTIYSTVPGGYAYMSGTSMAAPFVTGTAALLFGLRPQATYAQVRQAILDGVDVRDYRVETHGRLNIAGAIAALKKMLP